MYYVYHLYYLYSLIYWKILNKFFVSDTTILYSDFISDIVDSRVKSWGHRKIFQNILTWYFATAAMVNMEELAVLARWVTIKNISLA